MGVAEAALVLAAVGTAGSVVAGNKQAKQQKKAAALQQQGENVKRIKEQQRIRAQALKAAGESKQSAASQGAIGSSASIGGLAGATTAYTSNATFLDQMGSISNRAFSASMKAAKYGQQASMWGSVASLGSQAFSAAGGFGGGGDAGLAASQAPTNAPGGSTLVSSSNTSGIVWNRAGSSYGSGGINPGFVGL